MLETAFLYRSIQLYHCFILTDACFLILCFAVYYKQINDDDDDDDDDDDVFILFITVICIDNRINSL